MTLEANRAVIFYSAINVAIDHTKKQLAFKQQDLFRSIALKMMLASFETEKAALAAEFPVLSVADEAKKKGATEK